MKKFVYLGLLASVILLLVPRVTIAQTHSKIEYTKAPVFQYVVKFMCGRTDTIIAAPGRYFTAVNVHNPSDAAVKIRWKLAIALRNAKVRPVSEFFADYLGPDEALEIDCRDVFSRTPYKADFLTGFLVIESISELDVVAVYTAGGVKGEVQTLDVEYVTPRSFVGCPDLTVIQIGKPLWDATEKRSVISVTIKNIGNATAGPTVARVIDPTTFQSPGVPYSAVATTPSLAPGAVVTIKFFLPYWVYNPDVTLEATADYNDMLPECNEDNNVKVFTDVG